MKRVLAELTEKFRSIVADNNLGDEKVQVSIGTLTPQQAIGSPTRQDFPILIGREVMIEAQFRGSCGQAFTDGPREFSGSLRDVLGLSLESNEDRAVFIAALNAVMAYLGMAAKVRHCRNEEPEECAGEIAGYIKDEYGNVKVGLIGLQPAILERLAADLGTEKVRCTDLNSKNVGSGKSGVEIWDGGTDTGRLIDWADLLLVTSSTIVNDSFDDIREGAAARGRRLIIFGVTGAGAAALLGLERVCFKAG
jgi:uncharacterized protein (DUF4213/DUF364 family)